ncbi:hypothetical protein [Xenophilus sp. Marseille-Q4582]|uniref:hypothetical protein n=1 Tax=Xenophilus sp. Marseille-Q4582 TaxID=2866600 RepID=UPI001CE42915|nr:hypothetical protein [Xenophilus sp. Marseille-Q4582]
MNKPIAIIGTAGRGTPLTKAHWDFMVATALEVIPAGRHVVSGGAAWADHVAVRLLTLGHAGALTLHLPAPMDETDFSFVGVRKSAGSAANYYHHQFSQALGEDTRAELFDASQDDRCFGTFEPAAPGYSAMFTRNRKVAATATGGVLAFTFGEGDVPADGGTKHTWDLIASNKKFHYSLASV